MPNIQITNRKDRREKKTKILQLNYQWNSKIYTLFAFVIRCEHELEFFSLEKMDFHFDWHVFLA